MQAIHLIWGSSSKKVITTGAGSLQKAALGDWECLCENPKVGQGRVKIGSRTERLWILGFPNTNGSKVLQDKTCSTFLKNKLQTRATRVTIKANSGENMSKIKACLAKNTVTLQPTNYKEQWNY